MSEIIFPAGTMHVMPITNSAIVTFDSNTRDIHIQQHPHPLRSHNSSKDILAEQLSDFYITQQQPNKSTTTNISSISSGRKPSHHRRSSARSSIDASEFQVKEIPSSIHRPETRFRNDTHKSSSRSVKNFSLPSRDYPVIPVRPPLRPTVSFGAISHHSYDSTSPIVEKTFDKGMIYEKRASMEGKDIKPALSHKLHSCLTCCFSGSMNPSED